MDDKTGTGADVNEKYYSDIRKIGICGKPWSFDAMKRHSR